MRTKEEIDWTFKKIEEEYYQLKHVRDRYGLTEEGVEALLFKTGQMMLISWITGLKDDWE